MFRRILPAFLLLNTLLLPTLVGAQGVFVNVPEAAGYQLAYQLNISNGATFFNSGGVPYAVDNTAGIATGSFNRVAYYLELTGSSDPGDHNGFMYVSFDAAGFTNQANKIGVPNTSSGEFYQQNIGNMNIVTNLGGITTGTGLSGGSIQFWHTDYSPTNSAGVPNASGTTYDWGDQSSGGANYGAMQIANHSASQELLAYNQWGGDGLSSADVGIGSNTTVNGLDGNVNPNWTFSLNAAHYSTKTLQILVGSSEASTPEPGSVALLVSLCVVGTRLLHRRRK